MGHWKLFGQSRLDKVGVLKKSLSQKITILFGLDFEPHLPFNPQGGRAPFLSKLAGDLSPFIGDCKRIENSRENIEKPSNNSIQVPLQFPPDMNEINRVGVGSLLNDRSRRYANDVENCIQRKKIVVDPASPRDTVRNHVGYSMSDGRAIRYDAT
ncbi:hypothetical protein GWI33_003950 [Rhynchophorus ferrugineus]|uniref:Uncharacterized protein n=1 Tax=Rhynchophorus ferrugineus TaxID=354439 RepID=A0A834M2P6_RHYFE|nr:hypothetical protein GWI33_003950 [Rhynchophorus ferrugineus]